MVKLKYEIWDEDRLDSSGEEIFFTEVEAKNWVLEQNKHPWLHAKICSIEEL